MILSEPNTVRSGYWKSRRSLLCLLCVLIILMSAGSTNADSDNDQDDDSSNDGDDSDNYRDDDSLDDDDDSDNYRDDDSLDDDDDSSGGDNYEMETSESPDYIPYSDREEETADKSNTYDNTAEDQRGNQDEDEIIPAVLPDKEDDYDVSESSSQDEDVVSTYSSGKGNNEKEIEQSIRDNDKKDDTNSDETKGTSSVSTDQNENKDTKTGDDNEKPTDNVKNDKDGEVDIDDRKDSSDNINTDSDDSDDSVKDNPANTASSSTTSLTRGSSTESTTSIPEPITTITTENSDNLNTGTTSNSANKGDSSTDLSSVSSSTDNSNTSQTTNPAINQDNESNVSANVSPTVTEDANFLKDFRDSTEAHDNIELKDYSFASLVKGQEAVFEFGLEGNNIVSINFISEVNGGQVKTVVEILKNTSTLINEAPPGTVYKNFNIWVGDAQFSPYMTNDAKVNFKVGKDWLLSNNIDHESIVLYGHVNGWSPLVTEKTGEDDTYVYYTAHTPVFSVFAIVSMDYEPYKLDKDQAVSTIGDTAAASGGMDEIPHYNTYRNVAFLLVSLLVAGVVGMAGLKYMARPGNEDE